MPTRHCPTGGLALASSEWSAGHNGDRTSPTRRSRPVRIDRARLRAAHRAGSERRPVNPRPASSRGSLGGHTERRGLRVSSVGYRRSGVSSPRTWLESTLTEVSDGQQPRPPGTTLLTILCVSVFLVHLIPAWQTHGPIVLWDEPGYLGNARFLASGFGRTPLGYQAGYSLLLVPAAWASDDPLTAYRLSLLTNAVLAVATVLLAHRLSHRIFPAAAPTSHLVAAVVVAVYSGFVSLSTVAMSENAFVPAVLACALAIGVAVRQPGYWYLAGFLAAYASLLGPRGLVVVGAFAVSCAVSTKAWRHPATAGPAVALAVTFVFGARALNRLIAGTGSVAGLDERPLSSTVETAFDPSNWGAIAANFCGRFAYLSVGTVGLAVVGLVASARAAKRRTANATPFHAVGTFALVCASVTVVVGAVRMVSIPPDRVDLLVYGRYTDAIVAPLLVIGSTITLGSLSLSSRIRRLIAGSIALCTAAATILADRLYAPASTPAHWSPVNVLALEAYPPRSRLAGALATVDIDLSVAGLRPSSALVVRLLLGTGVTLVVLTIAAALPRVGTLLAALVMLYSSWYAYTEFVLPSSRQFATSRVVVSAVENLESRGVDSSCILVDEASVGIRANSRGVIDDRTFYRFHLPRSRFERADLASADCGPLIISARTGVLNRFPDAQLVAREHAAPTSLWIATGGLDPEIRAQTIALIEQAVPPP